MGVGLREVIVVLLVAVPLGGVIALVLPRKWVSLKIKRIILGLWIVLGLVQIMRGAAYSNPAGVAMFTYGLSEVVLAGGGLLVLTERRWKRIVGACAITLGLLLIVVAGSMSQAHGPS